MSHEESYEDTLSQSSHSAYEEAFSAADCDELSDTLSEAPVLEKGKDLDASNASSIDEDELSEAEEKEDEIVMSKLNHFAIFDSEDEKQPKKSEERMTLPILTKYEKTRILSLRANQIIRGSDLFIELYPEKLAKMNAMEIAEEELEMRSLPFKIRRFFPDQTYEEWSLTELKQDNFGWIK